MSAVDAPPPDDEKADEEGINEDVGNEDDVGDNDNNDSEMDGDDQDNGGSGSNGSEPNVDDDDEDDEDDEFQEWFADSDSMDFYDDDDNEGDFFPDDDDDDDFFRDDDEEDSDFSSQQDDVAKSSPPRYIIHDGGTEYLSSMWAMAQEEDFADTEVTFEDGQKMKINRIILASMSEYFKNMLSIQMREALEGKITLPTVSLKNFKYVLAFCLGQRQELASREELLDVLELADMWQMGELVGKCLKQLKENVTPDNALETYFYLNHHNYTEMKLEVRDHIQTHFRQISQTDEYKHLKEAELLPLLDISNALYLSNDVLEAALKWLEVNSAEPSLVVKVLDAALSSYVSDSIAFRCLLENPMVWLNEEARKLVCEKLATRYKVCLLAFGHEVKDNKSQSTMSAWDDLQQEWTSLEPLFKVKPIPAHSSLATDECKVYITGGELGNKAADSTLVFRPTNVNFGFCFDGFPLNTARMQHASAVVKKMLYVAGGLPGPMSSVEMCNCDSLGTWHSVGSLPVAVCFCSSGVLGNTLVVAGYRTQNLEQHVIQTFDTETHAAQIITLDMGCNSYLLPLGNLGGLHCLSSDGVLLELSQGDSGSLEVKGQTQLENFDVQAPFVALFDGRKLVVFDVSSSPVRVEKYGVDGKKEDAASPFHKIHAFTEVVGLTWSLIRVK